MSLHLACRDCGSRSLFLGHEDLDDEAGYFYLKCLQCSRRLQFIPKHAIAEWMNTDDQRWLLDSDRQLLWESTSLGFLSAGYLVWCGIRPETLNWVERSGKEFGPIVFSFAVSPPLVLEPPA